MTRCAGWSSSVYVITALLLKLKEALNKTFTLVALHQHLTSASAPPSISANHCNSPDISLKVLKRRLPQDEWFISQIIMG